MDTEPFPLQPSWVPTRPSPHGSIARPRDPHLLCLEKMAHTKALLEPEFYPEPVVGTSGASSAEQAGVSEPCAGKASRGKYLPVEAFVSGAQKSVLTLELNAAMAVLEPQNEVLESPLVLLFPAFLSA